MCESWEPTSIGFRDVFERNVSGSQKERKKLDEEDTLTQGMMHHMRFPSMHSNKRCKQQND
jgi:hypothetical protein